MFIPAKLQIPNGTDRECFLNTELIESISFHSSDYHVHVWIGNYQYLIEKKEKPESYEFIKNMIKKSADKPKE